MLSDVIMNNNENDRQRIDVQKDRRQSDKYKSRNTFLPVYHQL